MPTYEYVCTSCENQWEEIQKISEPSLTDCPKCKNATAKRQISGGSFILKGGGWYADLYSSSGGKKKADGGESKSETKSESKSESTTTESKSDTSAKPAAPAAAAAAAPAPAKTPAKPST